MLQTTGLEGWEGGNNYLAATERGKWANRGCQITELVCGMATRSYAASRFPPNTFPAQNSWRQRGNLGVHLVCMAADIAPLKI